MPDPIEAVEAESEGGQGLDADLDEDGQRGKACGEGGRLQMPAKQGGDEVGEAEDVETRGERGAGDTVECGQIPGDLRSVDGEMGGHGAMAALFGQDLFGGGLRDLRRGCWSKIPGRLSVYTNFTYRLSGFRSIGQCMEIGGKLVAIAVDWTRVCSPSSSRIVFSMAILRPCCRILPPLEKVGVSDRAEVVCQSTLAGCPNILFFRELEYVFVPTERCAVLCCAVLRGAGSPVLDVSAHCNRRRSR